MGNVDEEGIIRLLSP